MGVGGHRHDPAALPPGKTGYPLYRKLDWPQGRSGRVRKISPPPGLDTRTVQPVAIRYTDWAIPAALYFKYSHEISAFKIAYFFPVILQIMFSHLNRTS
jgi:hypothetical protein